MELKDLPGLGPKRIKLLKEQGIYNISDLLRYIPRNHLDRTIVQKINNINEGDDVVLIGKVIRSQLAGAFRKQRLILNFSDGSGEVQLVFFHAIEIWERRLKEGKRLAIFGKIQSYNGWQIVHPDIRELKETESYQGEITPIYPLSEAMKASKIEQNFLRKLIQPLFENVLIEKLFPNQNIPSELRKELALTNEFENLRKLHFPKTIAEVNEAYRQLKLQELLPFCMRMVARRQRIKARGKSHILKNSSKGYAEIIKAQLPFELTKGQEKVIAQIKKGMAKPHQYQALLQGDVGSGKTIVAILAMTEALEAGYQVAIMAPTDILVRQHHQFMQGLLREIGVDLTLVTGDLKAKARKEILLGLETGIIKCAIGTHALFSKDVVFSNLGFIVVDEQHRFGVGQREALLQKGDDPDMLVMSATPIPRSLTMTLYGDLEAIILDEKPAGRKEIKSRLIDAKKRQNMKQYILKEIKDGNQCYWIVPRVADIDDQLKSVEEVFEELKKFSTEWIVGFVHGKVDEYDKGKTLEEFNSGKIGVLVATTVVEVGVDVPNSNIIVIEQPERFGLAQLHQLRGRVGRGDKQAWCFLMINQDNPAYQRINDFAETTDGFEIAELDLQNRGSGNLEGVEQSGAKLFKYFDLLEDKEMIESSFIQAEAILENKLELNDEAMNEIKIWIAKEEPDHGIH